MNILYVYADMPEEWNCSEWRCKIPHDAINKLEDHKARMLYIKDWLNDEENSEWADIIIIQRNLFSTYLANAYYWRIRGKPVVLDLDDAYSYMTLGNSLYNFWRIGIRTVNDKERQLDYIPYEHLLYGAQIVNAITAASPILVQDWANKVKTYHIPNYPDVARYEKAYELKEDLSSPIVIGWAGSSTHYESFRDSNVIPALRRLNESQKIKIAIGGNDKRIIGLIRTRNVDQLKIEHIPFVPINEFPNMLKKFDIGLAPLAGLYDRRRSTIKVLEYMLMGIPVVATNYEPYYEFADYIKLIDNQTKYWLEALENTIKFRDIDHINKARKFALSYDINLNIHKTLDIYQQIINEGRKLL